MHIVLVGSDGFLGRYLRDTIISSDSTIYLSCFTRTSVSVNYNAEQQIFGHKEWIHSSAIPSVDTVIYLAWDSTPYSSIHGNNGTSISCLNYYLEEIFITKIPQFIFISTAGAFYKSESKVICDEETEPYLGSPYARDKLSAETLLKTMNHLESLYILRPSNIYGPGQTLTKGMGIIPALINTINSKEKITLYESMSSERDYLYIDDFVSAINQMIYGNSRAGAYNLSTSTNTSLEALIEKVESISGKTLNFEVNANIAPNYAIISNQKFNNETGWRASVDIEQGLRRVLSSCNVTE